MLLLCVHDGYFPSRCCCVANLHHFNWKKLCWLWRGPSLLHWFRISIWEITLSYSSQYYQLIYDKTVGFCCVPCGSHCAQNWKSATVPSVCNLTTVFYWWLNQLGVTWKDKKGKVVWLFKMEAGKACSNQECLNKHCHDFIILFFLLDFYSVQQNTTNSVVELWLCTLSFIFCFCR